MKRVYKIAGLVLLAFTISSCSMEDTEVIANKVKAVKDSTVSKCCASTIPARFPIKNNSIPQPATGN